MENEDRRNPVKKMLLHLTREKESSLGNGLKLLSKRNTHREDECGRLIVDPHQRAEIGRDIVRAV
jgi:hypothetical protein